MVRLITDLTNLCETYGRFQEWWRVERKQLGFSTLHLEFEADGSGSIIAEFLDGDGGGPDWVTIVEWKPDQAGDVVVDQFLTDHKYSTSKYNPRSRA